MYFGLDVVIVIVFLITTLIFGLYYGRGIKTIKNYALGGRNFSTGALVATIVATWASGSGFFVDLTKTYSKGLEFIIPVLGVFISFALIIFIFIPKMERFLGNNSIAEAIGNLYGQKISTCIAVAGIISSAGSIAVQFNAFGNIIGYLLEIPGIYAILLAGATTTIYSAFGGIRSVTLTDFIQLLIFGCIIPLLGFVIWNHTYDTDFTITKALENPKFNFNSTLSFNNPNIWNIIFLFCYFTIPHMKPTWFQRISMGSSITQVKKAFTIAVVTKFFLILSIIWIPFLIWSINPNIKPHNLFSYVINNYTNTGLKGLVIIAITAMSMSTADSYINSSSVLFANDLCKPLKLSQSKKLMFARMFALLLGLSAVMLSITTNDLLGIHILANSFYMPIATPIILLTILGYKYNVKSILIAMCLGLLLSIIWKICGWNKVAGVVFSTLLNLSSLILSNYLFNSKNTKNDIFPFSIVKKSSFQKIDFISLYTKYCFKPKIILPKNELNYIGLGVYLVIYTISTMYATQVNLLNNNNSIILLIYQIMIVSGMIMTMYPLWPNILQKKRLIQISWPIIIFIELIFFSSFFVMVSNFGQLQFAIFTTNLILSIILLGWQIAIPMIVIGFYLSIEFFKYYNKTELINFSIGSPQFIFMYTLLIIGAVLAIFLKPKQEHLEATESKVDTLETEVTHLSHEMSALTDKVMHYDERIADKEAEINRLGTVGQKILNNVSHELRLPVGNVMNFSDMLKESLQNSNDEYLKELSNEVVQNSTRLSSMILNMLDLAMLDAKKIELQKSTANFSELVKDRVKRCRSIYLQNKQIDFKLTIQPELVLPLDPHYIRQTIDNLVINAINFSESGLIEINVFKQTSCAVFTICDQGKGIPSKELLDIFTPFKMASNTSSKAQGRGVGLALCKAAVEAHGGMIKAESNRGKGALFRIALPL